MKKGKYITAVIGLVILVTAVISFRLHDASFSFAPTAVFDSSPHLIIDAGHGGADGGAVSKRGTVESGLNLDIALKLRDLAGLFGLSPVMTRESEKIAYPPEANTIAKKKVYDQHRRSDLINATENGVLISIHQNTYPSGKPSGAQVLYSENENSRSLADTINSVLCEALGADSSRAPAQISDSVYLLKKAVCPAVLVECGFISNVSDENLLLTEEYRLKLAMIILTAYMRQCVITE